MNMSLLTDKNVQQRSLEDEQRYCSRSEIHEKGNAVTNKGLQN